MKILGGSRPQRNWRKPSVHAGCRGFAGPTSIAAPAGLEGGSGLHAVRAYANLLAPAERRVQARSADLEHWIFARKQGLAKPYLANPAPFNQQNYESDQRLAGCSGRTGYRQQHLHAFFADALSLLPHRPGPHSIAGRVTTSGGDRPARLLQTRSAFAWGTPVGRGLYREQDRGGAGSPQSAGTDAGTPVRRERTGRKGQRDQSSECPTRRSTRAVRSLKCASMMVSHSAPNGG